MTKLCRQNTVSYSRILHFPFYGENMSYTSLFMVKNHMSYSYSQFTSAQNLKGTVHHSNLGCKTIEDIVSLICFSCICKSYLQSFTRPTALVAYTCFMKPKPIYNKNYSGCNQSIT